MKRVRLLLLLLVIIIVLPSYCGAAGVDDPVTRKAAKFGSVKVTYSEDSQCFIRESDFKLRDYVLTYDELKSYILEIKNHYLK